MKSIRFSTFVFTVVLGVAICTPAQGADPRCSPVQGSIFWTVIPVPDNQLPRVVGSVTGSLRGSSSAVILQQNPPVGPSLTTRDQDIFVVGPGAQDILVGNSDATFTFTATPGEVLDSQNVTIVNGTGRFAGASGNLQIRGKGFNFPPSPGGPVTFFDVDYWGQVCVPVL